ADDPVGDLRILIAKVPERLLGNSALAYDHGQVPDGSIASGGAVLPRSATRPGGRGRWRWRPRWITPRFTRAARHKAAGVARCNGPTVRPKYDMTRWAIAGSRVAAEKTRRSKRLWGRTCEKLLMWA